jgi:hypothetical protein
LAALPDSLASMQQRAHVWWRLLALLPVIVL